MINVMKTTAMPQIEGIIDFEMSRREICQIKIFSTYQWCWTSFK